MKTYPEEEYEIRPEVARKRIRKAFAGFIVAGLAGFALWYYISNGPKDNDIPRPLRKVLEANEKINKSYRSNNRLVAEFPVEKAVKKPRINGQYGMHSSLDTSTWKLLVYNNKTGQDSVLYFTMNDIRSLPKRDIIFDFKCIEGWSQVTHWGGCLFSDFCKKYKVGTTDGEAPDLADLKNIYEYVGMETPDGDYYVGIDMQSALHPQTILCYEMNGKPLPANQGAPLRLIIPSKYGVKSIKRLSIIKFGHEKPRDFWKERGYDYDAGL